MGGQLFIGGFGGCMSIILGVSFSFSFLVEKVAFSLKNFGNGRAFGE
jgi:hypothetical protein